MNIGILGPKGTFSDVARMKYEEKINKKLECVYYPSLNQVFSNYKNLDLMIVPIENTLDGHITQCLDEILEKKLNIIDEIMVDVKFSCLSNAKKLEDIKTLNVQFKAKGQCVNFINSLNCKINVTESNIESLNLIKDNLDAAIVPHHVFDNSYNIAIEDVTDSQNNQTKFFVLSREKSTKGNKCYFCMKTIFDDRKGLLCDILKILDDHSFNLAFILSRPTKKELGKYNFFAEINKIDNFDALYEAFSEIEKNHLAKVEILGIY